MTIDETLPSQRRARVGWAYQAAEDVARTEARFDAWADEYDADVAELCDWRGPAETVGPATRYLAAEARILDAGAGTGLVGETLAGQGYSNMVAVDLSQRMLDVAHAKSIYRETLRADLMEPLPFPDGSFDAVLSIGTSGYVTGQVIPEFARLIGPGGHIIYTTSDARYRDGGFEAAVRALQRDAILESVEIGPEFLPLPLSNPEHTARIHVLRKLP
ncbi:MAG: class I SAM-dependent methyltransferase [Alphaproteobacteria bacterium]|nr:class I SAM-dependent methyltransferase [Alphaproteobacteria bacterium]